MFSRDVYVDDGTLMRVDLDLFVFCALLLSACALCLEVQGDGWTPLRIARSEGHAAVIATLNAAGGR